MTPDEWNVFQRMQMQQAGIGLLTQQYTGLGGLGYPSAGLQQYQPAPPYVAPAPLETGTKVEDLIGWRVWRILNTGMLQSYSAGSIWLPGQPMTGTPGDHDEAGVWAFKDMTDAFRKATDHFAVGSVRLWGQVVEHEKGYRAEFARIVSIELACLPLKYPWDRSQIRALKWLRKTYGVE